MISLKLKFRDKLILHICLMTSLIGFSIVLATWYLSENSKKTVQHGVVEKLTDVQDITASELTQAKFIAYQGIAQASDEKVLEQVIRLITDQQRSYQEILQDEISTIAKKVSITMNEQNGETTKTLDELLEVSENSMNRIMELDKQALEAMADISDLTITNLQTISVDGIKRLLTSLELFDSLFWETQESTLDRIDELWSYIFFSNGPYDTPEKKENIKKTEQLFDELKEEIEQQQLDLFKKVFVAFNLEAQIMAEELKLLTKKVNYALGREIQYSVIVQDEKNIEIIREAYKKKSRIDENLKKSAGVLKATITGLEARLLSILEMQSEIAQKNLYEELEGRKQLAKKTKQNVDESIQVNTRSALEKIDTSLDESRSHIEQSIDRSTRDMMIYAVVITICCTVLAVILSYFIIRSITDPISKVLKFADKMAKGTIDERLPEGHDEVGEMGYALNKMADELVELQKATLNSFNQTLDQVMDCVFIFNPGDLRFTYVNRGVLEQVGYSREELYSMTPLDIKPDFTLEQFNEIIVPLKKQQKEAQLFTTVHKAKDETLIPVEVFLKYVVPPGNEPRFVAIVRDITEREMVKKEKERMQARLLQSQKLESVGQLAAGIAHEINTPTQFVGTNIEFLSDAYRDFSDIINSIKEVKENAPKEIADRIDDALEEGDWDYLKEEIPSALEQSREGIDRVSVIVGAMKNFSHPGSRDYQLSDLNKVIQTAIIVSSNEWKYVAEMEENLGNQISEVPLLVDEMGQVVLNMVVNSAHAIKKKMAEMNSEEKGLIRVSTREETSSIIMTIEDNGCGIPDDILQKVFDPFFTTKEVGKGTGQGLAISHDVIVLKHGGEIKVQSEVGVGSLFTISLPKENTENH